MVSITTVGIMTMMVATMMNNPTIMKNVVVFTKLDTVVLPIVCNNYAIIIVWVTYIILDNIHEISGFVGREIVPHSLF